MSETAEDIPDEWGYAGGEASRPIHKGGYYLHVYTNVQWENQHARRYYELRVDTANYTGSEGPTEHVAELSLREENYNDGNNREIDHLGYQKVSVDRDNRNDEETQQQAEVEIMAKAVKMIQERIND